MSVKNTLAAGISATNNMTLFSTLLSKLMDGNFKETDLLREFLEEHEIEGLRAEIIAWAGHYAVGILFATAAELAWKNKKSVGISDGILPGAIFGLIAVAVWRHILKTHPLSIKTKRNEFYMQLFIAHVIFGMTVAMKHDKNK